MLNPLAPGAANLGYVVASIPPTPSRLQCLAAMLRLVRCLRDMKSPERMLAVKGEYEKAEPRACTGQFNYRRASSNGE